MSLIFRHLKFLVLIFNYTSIKIYQYWSSAVYIRTYFVTCLFCLLMIYQATVKFCVKLGTITIETNELFCHGEIYI